MAQLAPNPRTAEFLPLLDRIRRAARATIALRGTGLVALLVAALVAVTFLTDWLFRFDPVQRKILAVLGWGAVAYIAFRFLYRPLTAGLGDENLAMLVERHHPTIADRLISALQFDRLAREGRLAGSPVFIQEVTRQARESLAEIDVQRCLDPAPRRQAAKRLGGSGLVGLVLALAIPGWAWSTWFDRVVLLGSAEWPKRSGIEIEDHKDYMARGESYTLVVAADLAKEIPDYVTVHYRYEGWKDWSKLEVPVKTEVEEDTGKVTSATYRTDEPFRRLMQPVEYWVEGGDDRSADLTIRLTDRPQITKLAFVAVYPEYSRGGQEDFSIDQEDLDLVHGTTLRIRMETNKELSWSRLQVSAGNAVRRYDFSPTGADREYELAVGIDETWADRSECEIQLLGVEGLREAEPKVFRIHARADAPPRAEVQVRWLKNKVTANAILPLWFVIEDDFAVQDARIVYLRYDRGKTESVDADKKPTWRFPEGEGKVVFGGRRIGPHTLAEDGMVLDTTAGLSPGMVLEFWIEATDYHDQVGSSEHKKLQIVDASDLIKDINTLQRHLRQEIERVLDKERETEYETHALRERYKSGGKVFKSEDRDAFAALERRQRSFVAKLQYIADQFEEIRLQMKYNQLFGEDIYNGVVRNGVVDPLRGIASGPLLQSAHRFADYAAAADPSQEVEGDLVDLAAQIREVITVLAEVLARIDPLEKFGEIIVKVKKLLEDEKRLLEDTKKHYVDGLQGIFDE